MRPPSAKRIAWIFCFVAACGWTSPARGASALGDWGHFMSYYPRAHLLNPDGRAFTVTFHFMLWPVSRWNKTQAPVRITDPDGEVVMWDVYEIDDNRLSLNVPAGPKGTYTVELGAQKNGGWRGAEYWMESDLPRAVLWTGDPAFDPADKKNAIEKRRVVFQASVPRTWWFWVPPKTNTFTVRAQRCDRYMSQREDWGFTVRSPRGQRIAVLWGQPPKTGDPDPYRREMVRTVEVEPGAAGRFWAIEVRLGDSHHHSNINFTLDGVPPYIARSPEEWFDADTGAVPDVPLYDETPFMQAAYEPKDETRWPHLQHWSPCPSLGDPDGVEIRGTASFAIWNPEGRPLRFAVGDYLPRSGLGKDAEPPEAEIVVASADGAKRQPVERPVPHYHHGAPPPSPLAGLDGKGVHMVTVSGVERWLAFTYPATPLAYLGAPGKDGWSTWTFEVGTARNWYFFVPEDVESFRVRAAARHETDVVHLEINAPDRTQALIYGNEGDVRVEAPEGTRGKIWHIRTDVGSATRMITRGGSDTRYLGIYLTLELRGVPAILSPTWEQWFDPARPVRPGERGNGRDAR